MNWINRKTMIESDRSMPASITEIRPLPSDPNLRRVRVGNKTVATLRTSDVEALGLEIGTAWTAQLERAVQETVALVTVRREAMKLLGRRQLSRSELTERLLRKGLDLTLVNQIADEMVREGWVDDAAMASALANELVRTKSAGRRMVQAKLKSRKIDSHLADDISEGAATTADEFANALKLARKKLAALADSPPHVAQRRIAATLARKGYDDEVIERVFEKLRLRSDAPEE